MTVLQPGVKGSTRDSGPLMAARSKDVDGFREEGRVLSLQPRGSGRPSPGATLQQARGVRRPPEPGRA